MSELMKAVTAKNYGNPSVLEIKEIPKPIINENEILVKVYSTTVNRTDTGILTAEYFVSRIYSGLLRPKLPSPGTDFAGVVESCGTNVTYFKPGDKVFGFYDEGISSQAQFMKINSQGPVELMPSGLSFDEASASLEGAHYGYNFINKVKIKGGEKVLIYGASGSIGTALVQLCLNLNLEVTAVCGSNAVELIKSFGVNKVIDYTKEDFTDSVEPQDFVFDSVGKSRFSICKKILKQKGIYISSELGQKGENLFLALFTPVFGERKVIFPIPSNCKRTVKMMKGLLEKGEYKAVIDKVYPLEKVVDAYKYVISGEKIGNVILKISV